MCVCVYGWMFNYKKWAMHDHAYVFYIFHKNLNFTSSNKKALNLYILTLVNEFDEFVIL